MIAQTGDARARLVALAAERHVSLAALSALIGRNAAYLQQFVRKGSPRKLEEGDRRTLARFLGVGESELGAPAPDLGHVVSGVQAPASALSWVAVPRLDAAASAGPGALGASERAVGALGFSPEWLRAQGLDPARLSAIAVRGDSMEPLLADGDEILVDTTPVQVPPARGVPSRSVHVVRVGDTLLVKRLAIPAPGRIALLSENPVYPPLEYAAEEVAMIGRVVWKGGRV